MGGDDFCDVSLGSNALYISFLRGFSVDIRRVLVGASLDGFPVAGRDGGTALLGRSPVSAGLVWPSRAGVCVAGSGGRLDDTWGVGRGGFAKGVGSGVGCVAFRALLCLSRGGSGLECESFWGLCVSRVDGLFRVLVLDGALAESVKSTTWAGTCLLSAIGFSVGGTLCRFGARSGELDMLEGGGGGCLSS